MTFNTRPSKLSGILDLLLQPAFLYLILPILGAFLGYQAGRWIFTLQAEGRFVRWKHLSDPYGPVEAIVAAGTNQIQVRTAGGLYACYNVEGCLKYEISTCWYPLEALAAEPICDFGCSYGFSTFKASSPPRSYLDRWIVVEHGRESSNETQYILTAGGEIWVWQWGNFSMGMIGIFFAYSCAGVVLGLIAGLLLAAILSRK